MSLNAPQHILLLWVSKKGNQPIEEDFKKLHIKYNNTSSSVELLNVQEHVFWTDTKTYNPLAINIQEAVINWICKGYSLRTD